MQNKWDVLLKEKGWNLVEENYKENPELLLAVCSENHRYIVKKRNVHRAKPCLFCRGIKATPEEIREEAEAQGYTLEAVLKTKDTNGNEFVKKASMVLLKCPKGHYQPMVIRDLYLGKQCATCYFENGYKH